MIYRVLENIEGNEKVVMTADTTLGPEIIDHSAVIRANQALFIFDISLQAFFACDMFTHDLVRFSINNVKRPVTEKAF